MAISLTKGGNVSLTKEAPGITKTTVGLGWNPRVTDGAAFDLDAIAFLVNESGKVRADNDFIFFNNLKSSDGSVVHNGDNRTGEGDGDDETLSIDLSKVPTDVAKPVIKTLVKWRMPIFVSSTMRVVVKSHVMICLKIVVLKLQ